MLQSDTNSLSKTYGPRSIVFLLKIQENVFQLFLKIKGLHVVNKVSTKKRPKRTSFANSNTKVNPAVPSEPRRFI